jgi:pimeloyl-ACP methyl ester carboxylesterase
MSRVSHPVEKETERPVEIEIGQARLHGDLVIPSDARGTVIFAHGSGSSRFSRRNRMVASTLRRGGFATLLMDLLSEQEELIDARTAELRFDIGMLAKRVVAAIEWILDDPQTGELPIGLFGASTGAAAALVAAAEEPDEVHAVVSRGGRPDLAGDALPGVTAPTLLIVGGDDTQVITLNKEAMARMTAPVHLEIIPGATHLFEEPGKLDKVAALAQEFYSEHLRSS